MNICQERDCQESDVVECRLPIYKNDIYSYSLFEIFKNFGGLKSVIHYLKHGWLNTYDYYCPEHCKKNGYCYGCGEFWAGSESFDFSRNGLCSNCRDDSDLVDYEEEEDDYWSWGDYYPDQESQ
jgi:hypothetical protein